MNMKSEKGYVLIMAVTLVIILLAASVGFYASVRYLATEIGIEDIKYMKGYYAALAALRFAEDLVSNPDDVFGPRSRTILPRVAILSYDIGHSSPEYSDPDNEGEDVYIPDATRVRYRQFLADFFDISAADLIGYPYKAYYDVVLTIRQTSGSRFEIKASYIY